MNHAAIGVVLLWCMSAAIIGLLIAAWIVAYRERREARAEAREFQEKLDVAVVEIEDEAKVPEFAERQDRA